MGKEGGRDLISVLLGVLIAPVEVFRMKGIGMEFVISLLLYIFTFIIGGIWYCFYLKGVNILSDIFCVLIPPLGVFFGTNNCRKEVGISALLWGLVFLLYFVPIPRMFLYSEAIFFLPAIVYSYMVA